MKKFSLFFLTLLAGLTLAACGNQAAEKKEKLAIVTTNSILSDLVKARAVFGEPVKKALGFSGKPLRTDFIVNGHNTYKPQS